ncbi:uncharacterized protein dbf4b [Antennarius striatus]|uniref:uncharacterized protein dbf4b n=1 Tax=Antennarius striatus TaxID=241820 RepID=UPI0035B32A5F
MQQRCAKEPGLLGPLGPGRKKLEGKTFYLDNVKKRSTALLLETLPLLGGAVESFLHRDVSFVVTGSQESLKNLKCPNTKTVTKEPSGEAQHPIKTQGSLLSDDKGRPGTPRSMACGSRGKALLEKAMRNNEQLPKNSVLASARSWGVKILYVDDVLFYLKQLTRGSFNTANRRPERSLTKQQTPPVVKAAALRSPYLKIEDRSRKYKPLHLQSMTFPSLYYWGRFSPFECPPPPRFNQQTEQGQNKPRQKKRIENSMKDKSLLSSNQSPWRRRKKDLSYCECCHQAFARLDEHLQSDQHRAFILDPSSYSLVDVCLAQMLPGFDPDPRESEETMNRTPLPPQDVCELDPLTDAEAEHAVQELQRRGSSLADPIQDPGPPPADIHPPSLSPDIPVLDVEGQDSAGQQPPCLSPHPYSLPPVLSPHAYFIQEPHSSYSDPPALSPQQYHAAEDEHMSENDPAEYAFESDAGPISVPHPHQGRPDGITPSRRSHSLPQTSPGTPNPKKRCRSASPELRWNNKRRRMSGTHGWTDPGPPEVWPFSNRVHLQQTLTSSAPDQTDVIRNGRTCAASQLSSRANPPLETPDSHPCLSHSTSACIESALIPNFLSQSFSDSEWDCNLLSAAPTTSAPLSSKPSCKLNEEVLHRPGAWMQDADYESRLHTVLQTPNQGASLCGEEQDPSAFNRTVVQVVEVQH